MKSSTAVGPRAVAGRRRTRHDEDAAMTRVEVAATLTGERMMAKYTGGRAGPSREEIARLAYHLFETRGRRNGQDVEDWLAAERELVRHYR